jgi:DNA topoisomerase IA
LKEQLISYGSCQFPTLGFVVERYKAIESFIPENFWKIKGRYFISFKRPKRPDLLSILSKFCLF